MSITPPIGPPPGPPPSAPLGPPPGPRSAPPPEPDPVAIDVDGPAARERGNDWRAAALVIGAAVTLLVGFLATSGTEDDADTAPLAATSLPDAPTASSAAPTTGSPRPGEIFLEPRDDEGPDPFTPTVAVPPDAPLPDGPVAPDTPSPIDTLAPPPDPGQVQAVSGATPGLYGGTRDRTACDPEQLVTFLEANPTKAAAWASVQQIVPSGIRDFVATLTPVVLRDDTRVTNYGFDGAAAPARQVVLQAGTAVLVDAYGTPRVRCFCGNPLSPPVPQADPTYGGEPWPSFDPVVIVVISPAPLPVDRIVIVDVWTGEPFERPVGSTGDADSPSDDPFLRSGPPADTNPPVDTTAPGTTAPADTAPLGDGTRYEGRLERVEVAGEVEPPPPGASIDEFRFVDGTDVEVEAHFAVPATSDTFVCLDVAVRPAPGDVVVDRATGSLSGSTTIRLDLSACGGAAADYPATVDGQLDGERIEFRVTFTAEGGTGTMVWTGERAT